MMLMISYAMPTDFIHDAYEFIGDAYDVIRDAHDFRTYA